MRKFLASLVIAFLLCVSPLSADNRKKEIKEFEVAKSATAELYLMNPQAIGGANIPKPICTAWNAAKVPGGYELFTADHCIDISTEDGASEPLQFAVSYEGPDNPNRILLPAVVVAKGNPASLATDIALLYVKTDIQHGVLELSDEKVQLMDRVVNWSASYASILQGSEGYIANENPESIELGKALDNAPWIVMPGIWKGSSGSAFISVKTGKVIEMCNIGVPEKGSAGVRAERMKKFLADNTVTSKDFKGIPVQPPADVDPND